MVLHDDIYATIVVSTAFRNVFSCSEHNSNTNFDRNIFFNTASVFVCAADAATWPRYTQSLHFYSLCSLITYSIELFQDERRSLRLLQTAYHFKSLKLIFWPKFLIFRACRYFRRHRWKLIFSLKFCNFQSKSLKFYQKTSKHTFQTHNFTEKHIFACGFGARCYPLKN